MKIRNILTRINAEKLVHACITPRLDYFNSLSESKKIKLKALSWFKMLQQEFWWKLNRDHIPPISSYLHWLPVNVKHNLSSSLLHRALNSQDPLYISDLIVSHVPMHFALRPVAQQAYQKCGRCELQDFGFQKESVCVCGGGVMSSLTGSIS